MAPAKALKIENVQNAGGSILSAFPISGWGKPRTVRVSEALPAQVGGSYAAILTEALLDSGQLSVAGLTALLSHYGVSRSASGLEHIRGTYQLIEGAKRLDSKVVDVLIAKATAATALIRCWQAPEVHVWRVPLGQYLTAQDLLDDLPNPFGEFDIAPECGSWFMRARDDDPFLFLAASGDTIADLAAIAYDTVLEVPGSMIYAI